MKYYRIDKEKIKCPRCGKETVPCINIQGTESKFWVQCLDGGCNTYIDSYIPMHHQMEMHKDPHKYIGIFGGYGSGKTVTSTKDDEKHILITPMGETLIGADTLVQIDNTIRKDFEMDMPQDFVSHYNRQKNRIHFDNQHILYYRPMNDEGNLRSLNLSRAHILEASETKHDNYVQLQTRLRNNASITHLRNKDGEVQYKEGEDGRPIPIIQYDTRKYIVESNPDAGWIRDDFLLKSGRISIWHDLGQSYTVTEPKSFMSSHIIPTKANYYLPEDFIEENAAGKPQWWIRRYLYGSFDYAEGLVYPEAMSTLVDDFEIPKGWKHAIAMDYGLNDNTHFVFAAVDTKATKPVVYIYKELVVNNMNIKEISERYKEMLRRYVPLTNLLFTPVMDAKSFSVRTRIDEKKRLGDLFLDEGVLFEPAQMDLDSRLLRTNTLFEKGHLKIFKSCYNLIEELKKYKFPEKKLHKASTDADNKPEDKNNHGVNALEFLVMEFPHTITPHSLGVYSSRGRAATMTKLEDSTNDVPLFPLANDNEENWGFQDLYKF